MLPDEVVRAVDRRSGIGAREASRGAIDEEIDLVVLRQGRQQLDVVRRDAGPDGW